MRWTLLLLLCVFGVHAASPYFEIDVVDARTGRGVPLVELETVNHIRFITDSAGRIAMGEPAFFGQNTFFTVRSHGYEFPKDGFGMKGRAIKVVHGGKATLKVNRINIAERLYRTTGEGIYNDSILLGYKAPVREPLLNAQVLGQDSIQRLVYRGKIFWFWGDTLRASYPLGNFRMSGAVSELPGAGGLDPATGINLRYFTNSDGFAKGMFPLLPKGDLIWADGFLVVTNAAKEPVMLAHYDRLKGLGKPLGAGLAIYNDRESAFEQLATLPRDETWRFPHGHPVRDTDSGTDFFFFGGCFPSVRVPATMEAILDRGAYEAFSCFADGTNKDEVLRDAAGHLVYRWTPAAPPTRPEDEARLIKDGTIKLDEARFTPVDVESGKPVRIHGGTVSWNQWRKKWIMIAVEQFGTSMLGEIWYAESPRFEGPWRKARKIVTHDKYSFYNPAQHPFFDQEGGRIIYFEGTYTAEFSGSPSPTPRYDYNQIMYRLDLSDVRLDAARN